MELLFPLSGALLLWSPAPPTFALALAALCLFFASGPAALLLGRRGLRRAQAAQEAARRRLLLWLVLGGALGLLGLGMAGPTTWEAAAAPGLLGGLSLFLLYRGRERNLGGESLVAVALSSAAAPVATSAGASLRDALLHSAVWALCFLLGTLAARGALIRKKDGGRGLGLGASLALLCVGAALLSLTSDLLDPRLACAPLPFTLIAFYAVIRPPPPKRMTRVGLALTAASAATLGWLIFTA